MVGRADDLKGIARDPDNNLIGGRYYWEYGDGGQSTPAAITSANADNLSIARTYTAPAGTLIVARLHVTDAAGESSSKDYRVLVKDRSLDVEVNKAIDDGLWWLYTNKQASAPGYRWLYDDGYYAFTKAMRLANPQEVTHLYNGFDWYGDPTNGMARNLVNRQNANGSWVAGSYASISMATAWSVIILTRTLFEKPPVAIIHAEPNPGAVGQQIQLDARDSYHVDPAKQIVEYRWDFNASNGVDFNNPDAVGAPPRRPSAPWATTRYRCK